MSRMSEAEKKKNGFIYNIKKYKALYLFLLPGIIYYIIFHYIPMYGIVIAFQDFNPTDGIFGSQWVGFQHFINLFKSELFTRIMSNTLIISVMKLVIAFPFPIILALMINDVRNRFAKKAFQSLSYLPNFMSWVVITGMVYTIFNSSFGVFANLFESMGLPYIDISKNPETFRWFILFTTIWKSTGWSSILFLAAITSIDEGIYEAARIDGANKFQQIMKITLPCLAPTIAIVMILNVGSILNQDFEQIYMLTGSNPELMMVSEVLESYVYREGILKNNFSFPAAVGLFQSTFGLVLIMITNKIAHKLGYDGIW